METIGEVVDEIFEKQFPGQMIQVLSDDIIIRGKTRNWDPIMKKEEWDYEITYTRLTKISIKNFDEINIQFPPSNGKESLISIVVNVF